ncbi:MAG: SAM-dependent methyltransferase [Bacteroidales bacterium]|nr:SAM-dependent methyltransferase [Bacteroidales bacterium]MDD4657144.1 SAM-dependent methyltransferase [Bacteroidales bacterium]
MKGTLYLIPSPIGDIAIDNTIPKGTLDILLNLKHFVVEELRTVRRYLSKAGLKGNIESLELYLLNEHSNEQEIESYLSILLSGVSMGMISEAGLPAVADPGAKLVALAHKNSIDVVPLVGPSSLMLALMASGKNGQNFAFVGYLPIKIEERRSKIRELEKLSLRTAQSQIIIETPYRNDALMADFLQTCSKDTLLTVATNITTPDSFIKTRTISQWKRAKPELNKKPTVFIL